MQRIYKHILAIAMLAITGCSNKGKVEATMPDEIIAAGCTDEKFADMKGIVSALTDKIMAKFCAIKGCDEFPEYKELVINATVNYRRSVADESLECRLVYKGTQLFFSYYLYQDGELRYTSGDYESALTRAWTQQEAEADLAYELEGAHILEIDEEYMDTLASDVAKKLARQVK